MNKKGFILIGSLFLVVFLAIFLGASIMRADMQFRQMELRRASMCAFSAAEAGIDRAIAQLRMDGLWRRGFTNENLIWQDRAGTQQTIGSYTVTVVDGGLVGRIPTVVLTSVGRDALNVNVRRTITARVTVENPARFFTSTVKDLRLGDGLNITGSILGRDVVFEVGNRGISVTGNVEYIRNIIGQNNPRVIINDNDPNTNPDYYLRPPIAFIGVDLEKFRALAREGGRYEDGDFTISGDIDETTLRDPDKTSFNGLVFAEADVHISGNVKQSVNIVSARNIYIDDSLTCDVSPVTNQQFQIGLSAYQDVIIPEDAPTNITIEAFVIANGGVFEAVRTNSGKSALNFNGAIAVRGKDTARTGVNLIEYDTRNCAYNPNLRDNPQIPFMSYIVNLISWREI